MVQVARSLDWGLRLTSLNSDCLRVKYEKFWLAGSDGRNGSSGDASADVNETQLRAYCEAVNRLTAQGVDIEQAVEALKQCGGDLDAAEVWVGACASVGMFSMANDSETERSWGWEDEWGALQIAGSLQEIVEKMQASETGHLTSVANVLDTMSSAVTSEMREEVAQLELARLQTQQPHSKGLSIHQIRAQLCSSSPKLVAVQEILNPALWNLYTQHKETMAEPNEQWLFHGSGPENIANITVEGFDLALANVNGSFGAGVYFAKNSLTSQGFTRKDAMKNCDQLPTTCQGQPEMLSKARSMGFHVMLLCSVLVGRSGVGQQQRNEPPTGFDSTGTSDIHVIYKSAQAYPRYMLFLKS